MVVGQQVAVRGWQEGGVAKNSCHFGVTQTHVVITILALK